MIAESKITEIFCIADDFCKEFKVEITKNSLPPSAAGSTGKCKISDLSEEFSFRC